MTPFLLNRTMVPFHKMDFFLQFFPLSILWNQRNNSNIMGKLQSVTLTRSITRRWAASSAGTQRRSNEGVKALKLQKTIEICMKILWKWIQMIPLNNSHCLFKMKCLFNCKKHKETLKNLNIAAPCREEMHFGHENRFALVCNNPKEKSPWWSTFSVLVGGNLSHRIHLKYCHPFSPLHMTMRNALGWKSTLTDTCILPEQTQNIGRLTLTDACFWGLNISNTYKHWSS